MSVSLFTAAILAGASLCAPPQAPTAKSDQGRHWVFFADKAIESQEDLDRALEELVDTYNPRAITRRQARRSAPGLFDERDLPLEGSYVQAIEQTGADVHIQSRWLNAVSVRATPQELRQIAGMSFVAGVEPVRRGKRVEPEFTPGDAGNTRGFYGSAETQLNQINLIGLHQAGFTGQGIIIGILDTGFRVTHEAFNNPDHPLQVVAEWDFVDGDAVTGPEAGDPSSQHNHGTMILGTLGGYNPGTYVGGAYDASFVLCKTEDLRGEYPAEEDNFVAGLEFIEANGGDLATSSLGYIDWYTQGDLDGLTAVTTIGVNVATANGVYCCNAAGNGGHDNNANTSHLIAPADAFQVITCGAVASTGEIAGFSSDGPTADGRTKPELLAQGRSTWTVSPSNNSDYGTASGTSLSTPLVAGAVACLAQSQPTWTVDQLRNMMFSTADYFLANGTFDPLHIHGYGILDALTAFELDCNANGIPDPEDISSGSSPDNNGNGIPDECECPADFNGDGTVDTLDFLAFLNAFSAGDLIADFDGNGTINTLDFLAFLNAFNAGC